MSRAEMVVFTTFLLISAFALLAIFHLAGAFGATIAGPGSARRKEVRNMRIALCAAALVAACSSDGTSAALVRGGPPPIELDAGHATSSDTAPAPDTAPALDTAPAADVLPTLAPDAAGLICGEAAPSCTAYGVPDGDGVSGAPCGYFYPSKLDCFERKALPQRCAHRTPAGLLIWYAPSCEACAVCGDRRAVRP